MRDDVDLVVTAFKLDHHGTAFLHESHRVV
jgi:hypothetical protein